jgi:hypothetical protein
MSKELPPSADFARATPFEQLLEARLSRRGLLTGTGALAVAAAAPPSLAFLGKSRAPGVFDSVEPQRTDALVLAKGYRSNVVARWGDSLFKGQASLNTAQLADTKWLSAGAVADQANQFGTNCDAVAYFARGAGRGTLCVNHEYVNGELVFADFRGRRGMTPDDIGARRDWVRQHPLSVPWMQAAHGVSVMQVRRGARGWAIVRGATGTRRITANTPCDLSGPARGHPLLATRADPAAQTVLGTIANCAGGKTPWGTYLTAEENIDDYFGRGIEMLESTNDSRVKEAYRRFPVASASVYGWDYVDPRFDLMREPKEALRFGWIVEIDPERPDLAPRKRTALGRFQHEGANTILCRDGRVAAYMGDDEKYEYIYKFVTRDQFNPQNRESNRDLLDQGVLYVARFNADGSGEWLPLVHDENGPLNSRTGFASQGDIVIKARAAADLLGATPMDRPEDIEPDPLTGRIYAACTKTSDRTSTERLAPFLGRTVDLGANAANPRPNNRFGHIIEITETDDDAAATTFRWSVFLLAGDPREGRFLTDVMSLAPGDLAGNDTYFAGYSERSAVSPIFCPDNLGVDPSGRLWIVTDHDERGRPNNGCFVVPTAGPERGRLRQLASGPAGAELCGCEFTPDGRTLFLTVQHPGEGGSLALPTSDWPDGNALPARSSLIAIERDDGGPV